MRSQSRFRVASAALAALVSSGVCAEAVAGDQEKLDLSSMIQIAAGGSSSILGGDMKSLPEFAEVTKGMKSEKGLFTLWFYPPDAKDKDTEKLLCQIPAGFLGEQFMLSTSFSGGGFFTGFPLDERVVYWELLDKQLVLTEPETRYVIDRSKEVSDAVRRTYPERIRAAVPLVTKSPSGDPVIDLGAMLKSDFADIMWTAIESPLDMLGGGGRIDSSLCKWTKKKTFELNAEIGVELALSRSSPPGAYDKKSVHFSFWKLPQTDYTPRIADDRIGYFLTANQDWSKPTAARDLYNRYVDRWHLVKRDASLDNCEPRQAIVYYIEKTVPVRFRRAVRDGILEWNKAFEKCGFVNAVEVRQQTDDNEWKDLDPEDMRYSFFRWIVTGGGFAMGPHRANPFTGQIYDADIVFDDSMVRFFEQEAGRMMPSTAITAKFRDPVLEQFVANFPQWNRPLHNWDQVVVGGDPEERVRRAARQRLQQRGLHCCDYADGMKHQMMLGQTVLAAQPPEVIEKFLSDIIKEVVMHEVGHTLGLRHNFKASTIYTLDEIKRRQITGEATTGSVMDYNPALLLAKNPAKGYFVTPTIGPYDYWAIEYGYRPSESKPTEADAKSDKKDAEKDATAKNDAEKPAAAVVKADADDDDDDASDVDAAAMAATLKDIPKELREKLPPEALKALESGSVQIMMSAGGSGGSTPSTPRRSGPTPPSFKGAPAGEEGMLRKIASRASEPDLAYATDEDTTFVGCDPRNNRFDCASDPIDWARERITLVDARMNDILDWAVKDQESWYHLRPAFLTLMMERSFVLDFVGRYVGGQYFNRTHRGDKDAPQPFVLVEADRQRAALKFIADNLFTDAAFKFKPDVLNHLAPPRWWHNGANVTMRVDFPILDYISTLQWWNLFDRLFPATIARIHNAELKSGAEDKFTAAEYLQAIQKACWTDTLDGKRLASNTWTDAAPLISIVRRSLQREYLGLIEPLVRSKPGDALSPDLHAMVTLLAQRLATDLEAAIKTNKADFASQAHLTACKSRIDRMLAAELREFEVSPSGGSMFMQESSKR